MVIENIPIVCRHIIKKIEDRGYIIENKEFDKKSCVIDFRHPKIKKQIPIAYYTSSVKVTENGIETTIRGKVDRFKELWLDYCCEKEDNECVQKCRPHVNMEENILSVEANFTENPVEKFDRLLEELI